VPRYRVTTPAGEYEFDAPHDLSQEEYTAYLRQHFTPEGKMIGEEDELSFGEKWGPTAVRGLAGVGAGIASAVPGPGTFIGAGLGYGGEALAQMMEINAGQRQDLNYGVMATEAAIGAVPFGKAVKGATALRSALKTGAKRGVQAGAQTAVGEQARHKLETGEWQPLEETGKAAAIGGTIGVLGGMYEGKTVFKNSRAKAQFEADQAARAAEADIDADIRLREQRIAEIEAELAAIEGRKPSFDPAAGDIPPGVDMDRLPGELPPPATGEYPPGLFTEDVLKKAQVLRRQLARDESFLAGIDYEGESASLFDMETGKPNGPSLDAHLQRTASARTQEKLTREVADQGERALERLKAKGKSKREMRLYKRVIDAVSSGDIETPKFAKMILETNMGVEEFLEEFAKPGVREAAQTLNFYSQLQKKINALTAKSPEAREIVNAIGNLDMAPWWEHTVRAARMLDTAGRRLMLSQPVTFIRNLITNTGRFGVHLVDLALMDFMNVNQGGLSESFYSWRTASGRMKGAASLEQLVQAVKSMRPGRTNQIRKLLNEIDVSGKKSKSLLQDPSETGIGGRFLNAATFFPRHTELVYRRAVFMGTLANRAKDRGITLEKMFADPKNLITDDDLIEAISEALRVTFQADPAGKIGKQLLRSWMSMSPATTALLPYPRYFANAMRFFMEYNPLGVIKWMGMSNARRRFEGAKTLTRAITGTAMLSWALSVRYGPNAGERWHEVKGEKGVINVNGRETPAEKRHSLVGALGPFAPYLFIAEAIKQYDEYGSDWRLWTMNQKDIMQGIMGFQRIPQGLNTMVDAFRADSIEGFADTLGIFFGDLFGRQTTPFRALKDAISVEDPDQLTYYDPKEPIAGSRALGRLAAPTIQNVPGLPQALDRPAAVRVTRGDERTSAIPGDPYTGIKRQVTGATTRQVTPAEQALDEIGYSEYDLRARTGNARADREIDRRFGYYWHDIFNDIAQSEWWANLDRIGKEVYLKLLNEAVKEVAREDLEATEPALAGGLWLKAQFSEPEREYIRRHEMIDIDGLVEHLMGRPR